MQKCCCSLGSLHLLAGFKGVALWQGGKEGERTREGGKRRE